jgi:hypothetical protein
MRSLLRDHTTSSSVIPGLGEWEEGGLRCCLGIMWIINSEMVETASNSRGSRIQYVMIQQWAWKGKEKRPRLQKECKSAPELASIQQLSFFFFLFFLILCGEYRFSLRVWHYGRVLRKYMGTLWSKERAIT